MLRGLDRVTTLGNYKHPAFTVENTFIFPYNDFIKPDFKSQILGGGVIDLG